VRLIAVVALVGAAGILAGCSVSPGDAAVVGDRRISQAYLEQATTELAPLLSNPEPASVLSVLVVAPTFIDAAAEHGVGVSADEARTLLEESAVSAGIDPVPAFGEAALEVALFSLSLQNLQGLPDGDVVVAEVQAASAELDVDVNPRYGSLDPATGQISATTPDWIVPAAAVAP